MMALLAQGYDVISAQRMTRSGEGRMKRLTAKVFYWLMRKMVDERIQPEVGDFRLFSRRAIIAIRQLREHHRFMRGMVAWLGLREVILPYHRGARVAGKTKYSPVKMLRFAWTAISSFSALPLRLSVFMGLFIAVCGVAYAIYSVFAAVVLKATVPEPGGILSVIEHNPLNPITRLIVSRTPVDADAHLLNAKHTRALLSSSGAKVLETRYFLLFPERIHAIWAVSKIDSNPRLSADSTAFSQAGSGGGVLFAHVHHSGREALEMFSDLPASIGPPEGVT